MTAIIICSTIAIITITICITIYKISILKNPDLPKRLRWINSDIHDVKTHIKNIEKILNKNDINE